MASRAAFGALGGKIMADTITSSKRSVALYLATIVGWGVFGGIVGWFVLEQLSWCQELSRKIPLDYGFGWFVASVGIGAILGAIVGWTAK